MLKVISNGEVMPDGGWICWAGCIGGCAAGCLICITPIPFDEIIASTNAARAATATAKWL